MDHARYHLAQVNIGRARAAMDDPLMHGFVSQLAAINALADSSPGFVWRLQTEDGDATALRPYADERILVNMSVWESAAALKDYVYSGDHVAVMRDRRQWFEHFSGVYMALWWIPAGSLPTVDEAKQRIDHLQLHGETPYAFSFRRLFAAPEEAAAARS
jgi:heme-degrading monooxygenase HmoA